MNRPIPQMDHQGPLSKRAEHKLYMAFRRWMLSYFAKYHSMLGDQSPEDAMLGCMAKLMRSKGMSQTIAAQIELTEQDELYDHPDVGRYVRTCAVYFRNDLGRRKLRQDAGAEQMRNDAEAGIDQRPPSVNPEKRAHNISLLRKLATQSPQLRKDLHTLILYRVHGLSLQDLKAQHGLGPTEPWNATIRLRKALAAAGLTPDFSDILQQGY